jgi:hypothetical protein
MRRSMTMLGIAYLASGLAYVVELRCGADQPTVPSRPASRDARSAAPASSEIGITELAPYATPLAPDDRDATPRSVMPGGPASQHATASASGSRSQPDVASVALTARWTSAQRAARKAPTSATPQQGTPEVPVRVAFRALWYLGVDPEAERTWAAAINDPKSPPGVRSDLIVDMTDEGYSDNSHPTKDDLPTILARLEILERHAPYAMDDVNREAFEEAYRSLLGMAIRLGATFEGR